MEAHIKQPRIGVGITAMHNVRDALFQHTMRKHTENNPQDNIVYSIHYDNALNRKGIAKSKNECLRELIKAEVDHIFLFDDDCFPIHPDWYKEFIAAAQIMNQHHLMYIPGKTHNRDGSGKGVQGAHFGDLIQYTHSWGCMLYFTKECIEKAGGYNEEFEIYGYEHAELSCRIHNMGLTSFPFMTIQNVTKFIYSVDYEGSPPGVENDGTSSMTGLDAKAIVNRNSILYQKMVSQPPQKIEL